MKTISDFVQVNTAVGYEGEDRIHPAQDRDHLGGSCEHDNDSLSFIKGKEFLDQMSDYQLLKKASGRWS
jgi:hypothetical protein